MKKHFITFLLILAYTCILHGQNPIVPQGVYIADPSAHVWKDGKIYIYGSLDVSPKRYCSGSYKVLSSKDMINWDLSETSFSAIGENDQVPYIDSYLFAPDVQYFDNKYYLYYCLAVWGNNSTSCEGVAISDSPTGPFKNGTPITVGKYNEIDPCVFIDDDGQAYYIWGQFSAKIAKLKPDRMDIDSTTIVENIVTEKDHFFHEGSYMVKRNGLYYLLYADVSRGGAPTCLGYSVSQSPMGPYTYGGVIIDNKHSDPSAWNNHGSLVEFKNQWYVFYHRPTNNSASMRKACVEPIFFTEDGHIPEVQMTSQGAGLPLNAFEKIDASRACMLLGNVRVSTISKDHEVLAEVYHNDKAFYKYLDFKDGANSVTIWVYPGVNSCTLDLSLDTYTNSGVDEKNSIATINIPPRVREEWIKIEVPIRPTTGVHGLRLSFSDPSQKEPSFSTSGRDKVIPMPVELCKIDAIKFTNTTISSPNL